LENVLDCRCLYEESDPKLFLSELILTGSTRWRRSCVLDKKLKGRAKLVHFKDMAIREHKQVFAEVGEGNLNWPAILDACKEAGTEWMIVEQDLCYDRDPFESLGISLKNIKSWGIN